ncbi:hypothetical protein JOD43_002056 [Pullulanibacillus pueri]|nr:hypothetical protein [Pullulanibacillus pueri]
MKRLQKHILLMKTEGLVGEAKELKEKEELKFELFRDS